jgi:hypothetical protein
MDAAKNDVIVDMDGPLRAEQLDSRWYAVGNGMLIPCRDRAEAEAVALEFTRGRSEGGRQRKPT